jgi:hypothetical protein
MRQEAISDSWCSFDRAKYPTSAARIPAVPRQGFDTVLCFSEVTVSVSTERRFYAPVRAGCQQTKDKGEQGMILSALAINIRAGDWGQARNPDANLRSTLYALFKMLIDRLFSFGLSVKFANDAAAEILLEIVTFFRIEINSEADQLA